NLGWDYQPFVVPILVSKAWRMIGQRGQVARLAWLDRYECATAEQRELFVEGKAVALPSAYAQALAELRERFATERPKLATRQASQQGLDAMAASIPGLLARPP